MNNKYRTEVCRYWAMGKCWKEDGCSFRHTHQVIPKTHNRNDLQQDRKPGHMKNSQNYQEMRGYQTGRENRVTPNRDYLNQYKKPVNNEYPQHHHGMWGYQTERENEHHANMNHNQREQYENQIITNTEDFLWSRLNSLDKRQMIGMMTYARVASMPRK